MSAGVAREGRVRLAVRDDGRGISEASLASPGSLGLVGIHERARRLGGHATIEGRPGEGTTLLLDVPGRLERAP